MRQKSKFILEMKELRHSNSSDAKILPVISNTPKTRPKTEVGILKIEPRELKDVTSQFQNLEILQSPEEVKSLLKCILK